MKRKRNSKALRAGCKGKRKAYEEVEHFGTSITDVPEPIFKNIVLRLPIRAIIMCKCVCKPWRRVISDPQFAKMHFELAQPCSLVRTLGNTRVARMLYLIEPSDVDNYDSFSDSRFARHLRLNYGRDFYMKLDTKLKIPLRNAEKMPQPHNVSDTKSRLSSERGFKKRCVKVRPKEHKFQIVNSCKGFVCLSEPSSNNPLVVCNPVTGEYLNLPGTDESDNNTEKDMVSCGFGLCEETNRYKVVRMIDQGYFESVYRCPITGEKSYKKTLVEVHTLGTGTWRRIGYAPYYNSKLKFTTYLNGFLHWISLDFSKRILIYCFDLGREEFKSVQLPPLGDYFDPIIRWNNQCNTSLGVLRGSLCLCTCSGYDSLDIWVMKKYGEPKTWTKIVSTYSLCVERWPYCVYQPISFEENKGLLMFLSPKSAFIYYQPENYGRWKYFRILDVKTKYEAIAHVPSLISLKDVLNGDGMEILNINLRCSEYKLLGETKAICLQEVIREAETDTDHSPSEGDYD
ncbi:F-box protein At3g07870-like [Coffea eugenioides]|uniref:F-box protein At3g07870-like n=1 Tax=Coffea eugenioides TaxID=49369 RepID=UPI000F60CD4E|nr:F-box protein At3g07870-like [Coffea eugenioides]